MDVLSIFWVMIIGGGFLTLGAGAEADAEAESLAGLILLITAGMTSSVSILARALT